MTCVMQHPMPVTCLPRNTHIHTENLHTHTHTHINTEKKHTMYSPQHTQERHMKTLEEEIQKLRQQHEEIDARIMQRRAEAAATAEAKRAAGMHMGKWVGKRGGKRGGRMRGRMGGRMGGEVCLCVCVKYKVECVPEIQDGNEWGHVCLDSWV